MARTKQTARVPSFRGVCPKLIGRGRGKGGPKQSRLVARRVVGKRASQIGWEFEVEWSNGTSSWVDLVKLWEPGTTQAMEVLEVFARSEGRSSKSYESGGVSGRKALSVEAMRSSKGWVFKTVWSVNGEKEVEVCGLEAFVSCKPEHLGSDGWTSGNFPVVEEALSKIGGTWKQIHRKFVLDKGYYEGMVDGVSMAGLPWLRTEAKFKERGVKRKRE